jgi:hypothetical protein
MYVRLQTYRVDPGSRRRQGVFIASGDLPEEATPDPWAEEEMTRICRWFNHHLPVPPRKAFESDRAICWFRRGADRYVTRLWPLAALLRECGVPVELVTIRHPGTLTYQDHAQVVAIPPRGWGL